MTFHQNRLPRLNGNKFIILLLIALTTGGCNLFQQTRKPVTEEKPPIEIIEKTDESIAEKDSVELKNDSIADNKKIDKSETGKWKKKDNYRVAFILPFSIDAEELFYLMDNDNITSFQPLAAISFFEGALQALDTLRKMNVNLDVYTFDAAMDSTKMLELISSGQLDNMDLIIGPVFNECLIPAARFVKEKEIFLISPLSPSPSITEDNPYYVLMSPTLSMQLKNLANYIAAKRKPVRTIIIYQSNIALEQKLAIDFKMQLSTNPKIDTTNIHLVTDIGNLTEAIQPGVSNYIFIASMNELFVSQIFRSISLASRRDSIIVTGLSSILNFESISLDYLESLNFLYPEGYWLDPLAPRTKRFKNDFVAKYNASPDEYAARGFDVMLYTGYLLQQYGPYIADGFNKAKPSQHLLSPVHFNAVINPDNKTDYYENQGVTLLRYNNYRFEKVMD